MAAQDAAMIAAQISLIRHSPREMSVMPRP